MNHLNWSFPIPPIDDYNDGSWAAGGGYGGGNVTETGAISPYSGNGSGAGHGPYSTDDNAAGD